jgi:hypothetical protein
MPPIPNSDTPVVAKNFLRFIFLYLKLKIINLSG